jgi:hypothetical protein
MTLQMDKPSNSIQDSQISRSRWPRGLRRRSLAGGVLRLRVRIQPWSWMFIVSVVCCHVEVSATG